MNNVVEFEGRAAIERQAREWLVRMDGDTPLTETEIPVLREWMRRSALHREELERICKFWGEANVLTELAVCLESDSQRRARSRMRWARNIAVAACAILVSVILAWWVLQGGDWRANGRYQTGVGQQRLIVLSEGSSIQLNTDSQVQVAYDSHSRTIRLLQGEALFSVTPDPTRPFEVYAADSVVRAVGTAFAVYLDKGKVDVTVTKGVVDVGGLSPRQPVARREHVKATPLSSSLGQLKAGEMTRVDNASDHLEVQRLAEAEMQRKMAWQDGYMAFSGEPLSEVVRQINRYSAITLEVGDPKLLSVPIGGRFRIGDLDAVLEVLATNFGIRARRMDEHNLRLEAERPN